MSVERRGPLSFLDTEWRAALWRRWVVSHLVPESNGIATPSPIPVAPVASPVAAGPARTTVTETSVTSNDPLPGPAESAARSSVAPRTAAPPRGEAQRNEERRADVRARFDALSERLQGLEDAIDVIARRLSHRSRRERRTDRRTAELVESIAEHVEAHALAVDELRTTLERIERRLERIERPTAREEGERRDSRAPKARSSEPPRNVTSLRGEEASAFSLAHDAPEDDDAAISGASIRGSIGDMSLSTVLAMLEIERRSGRLKVQGEDGSLVAFELEDGSVVGSRVSENDIDAVESLREVLGWKNGRFWFRQNPSESQISPPRSVNSLLLEATRQIDEAIRVG